MSQSSPRARVAIVEDDAILREELARVVTSAEGMDVVGAAETLSAGQTLLASAPDVLLVDLALPDGNGVDLITSITFH